MGEAPRLFAGDDLDSIAEMNHTPATRRAAALTGADAALAGGWQTDLGHVLDALDLRSDQ